MIEVTVIGTWALVALDGELDAGNAAEIASVAADLAERMAIEVTVDLSRITFLGAAGVAALSAADRTISAVGGRMILIGVPVSAQRVLELSGAALAVVPSPGLPVPPPLVAAPPADDELSGLLSEVSRLLLTESTVTGDLQAVVRAAVELVPGCAAASVALLARTESYTAAVSSQTAVQVDLAQYSTGQGPCLLAAEGSTPIRVAALESDERFGRFAPIVGALGIHGVLSLPVTVGDRTIGSVNLYASSEFGPGAEDIGEVIAAQVAAALTKSEIYSAALALARRVQARADRERDINIAAGVLAGFEHCSIDQAERLLHSAARSGGDTLAAAAKRVIDYLAERGPGPA